MKYGLLIISVLLLWSCKKDQPPVHEDDAVTGTDIGVVSNEGNFMLGNASLSKIDLGSGNVDDDIYTDANSIQLGDVCQSVYFGNNRAYIVVNNSQKIVACNPITWQTEFTITGFNSPRYFLEVTPGKAYVSDIYDGEIAVVDLISKTITGHIACPGASEEMLVSGSYVFITRPNSSYIKVINIFTDAVVDSIQTGYGSNSIVQDANGKVWVLCGGNATTSDLPTLVRINPSTLQVENTFNFLSAATAPVSLTINRTYDTLLFLNQGVFELPISASGLPATPTITPGAGSTFYGLAVHPFTGQVYVCDARDYVQKGKIHRYKMNGNWLATYNVGYLPNHIYFP